MKDPNRKYTFKKPPGWKVIVDPSSAFDYSIRKTRDTDTMICVVDLGKIYTDKDMYSAYSQIKKEYESRLKDFRVIEMKKVQVIENPDDLFLEFSHLKGNRRTWEASYHFEMDDREYQVAASASEDEAVEMKKYLEWFITTFKRRTAM